MGTYRLPRAAENDLRDIATFIARDDIDAAARMIDALEAAMRRLSEMPGLGHARDDLTDADVLFWPVSSYLIVYRRAIRPLEIVRILHGRQDARSLLRG